LPDTALRVAVIADKAQVPAELTAGSKKHLKAEIKPCACAKAIS
jgi:hypothetical protein